MTDSCNAQSTIEKLRVTFANHGLPEIVVSDNGPAFLSKEFEEFMKRNGLRHVKSAPYHPSTNGLVERAVQTFKRAMKKQSGTLQTRLSRFLFKYRTTPHTTTGISPSELRWGTKLRSHLTLLQPDVRKTVRYAQHKQMVRCDQHARQRSVEIDDDVFVRNYSNSKLPWTAGKVIESTSPISAKVVLDDGKVVRRHHDQIRSSSSKDSNIITPVEGKESNISTSETQAVETQAHEAQIRRYQKNR